MEYRRFGSSIVARMDKGEVFGGHPNRAMASATLEVVIQMINAEVAESTMSKRD